MRTIMEQLLALQRLQFDSRSRTGESKSEMAKLRGNVPASILERYDRLASRGKKGVAIARNGVCSECHLHITTGALYGLAITHEIHTCDNCGRYLYLPESEPAGLSEPKPPEAKTAKRSPRKATAHAS